MLPAGLPGTAGGTRSPTRCSNGNGAPFAHRRTELLSDPQEVEVFVSEVKLLRTLRHRWGRGGRLGCGCQHAACGGETQATVDMSMVKLSHIASIAALLSKRFRHVQTARCAAGGAVRA